MPAIAPPVKEKIKNYLNGRDFSLESFDDLQEISDQDIKSIVSICNQTEVYNWLFKERLEGSLYSENDVREFKRYANEGWAKGEKFIFLIRDSEGLVAGALDIKANTEGAEIGYWADNTKRGFMTNAVSKLCEVAASAGFKTLTAVADPKNYRSADLLERAGFRKSGATSLRNGEPGVQFIKQL